MRIESISMRGVGTMLCYEKGVRCVASTLVALVFRALRGNTIRYQGRALFKTSIPTMCHCRGRLKNCQCCSVIVVADYARAATFIILSHELSITKTVILPRK